MNKALQAIFDNPAYDDLLKMDNQERYGEWIIYDDTGNNTTIASRIIGDSVDVLHVKGIGPIHRQAMKLKIDDLTDKGK